MKELIFEAAALAVIAAACAVVVVFLKGEGEIALALFFSIFAAVITACAVISTVEIFLHHRALCRRDRKE